MKTTSISLLERLKAASPDDPDWNRAHEIYLPMLQNWLGRIPGLGEDRADLVQEVWIVVIREIPGFERRREGSFRAWLRQVTVNAVRTLRKKRLRRRTADLDAVDKFLDRLVDPHSDLAREWDTEHDRYVFEKLIGLIKPDFGASAWEAFQRFAIQGQPAAQVAADLGISENAVLLAKSRILRRLRKEAGELLE